MAGPTKRRAQAEKDPEQGSSKESSSESRDPTQRSAPKNIPRLDGNRDPGIKVPAIDYTKPSDLKNISEFLGLAGWYTARGVSSNVPYPSLHMHLHSLAIPNLLTGLA
ncbi:hypothetical protein J1614_001928 [Plenodomus biglobosus]|nr:hypothetical protein J1614_001928 [Plenodomus biglobosus]